MAKNHMLFMLIVDLICAPKLAITFRDESTKVVCTRMMGTGSYVLLSLLSLLKIGARTVSKEKSV